MNNQELSDTVISLFKEALDYMNLTIREINSETRVDETDSLARLEFEFSINEKLGVEILCKDRAKLKTIEDYIVYIQMKKPSYSTTSTSLI